MSNKEQPLPSAEVFYLRTPLYEYYPLESWMRDKIQQIQYFQGPLDAYCVWCKQHSIFHRTPSFTHYINEVEVLTHRQFEVEFTCSRDKGHSISFRFLVTEMFFPLKVSEETTLDLKKTVIGKFGQYPSVADLNMADIGQYRRVLGDEKYRELSRAVGLAAHGVGIGSFVYLRRIFESLIEQAHTKASQETGWDEEAYSRSRMDEKILILKDYLPSFLVENRSLYSILSKGIHSLTEQECLQYFDTVRVGIELILDEKLQEEEKAKKIKEAKAAIEKARGQLSS